MQIMHFPNADNRNLLQAAANIAERYAFQWIMLVSILYSFAENLSIYY